MHTSTQGYPEIKDTKFLQSFNWEAILLTAKTSLSVSSICFCN